MRGYFGIGVEGVSKAMNVGSLFRTAHAFGAGFVFTVAAAYGELDGEKADTSATTAHLPFYAFPDVAAMVLPDRCTLIGVELTEDSIALPSFTHPRRAAYVMGPERGQLSDALSAKCAHVVQIPTKFSVNVGIAGALVMYDRLISLGRHAPRPVAAGGPTQAEPEHLFGPPKLRRRMEPFRAVPPDSDGYT